MNRLVGLGGDCQVAHHVKRLSPDYEKHFFDWLIVPAETVLALLENGFTSILQEDDLEPDVYQDRLQKVVDKRYRTWFVHDFQAFDQENIRNAQSKYSYLGKKFVAMLADGRPTTFVRRWHQIDGPESEDIARQLLTSLQRHKPNADLIFLHQDENRPPLIDGAYRSAYIPQVSGDWVGDEDAWTDILTRFSSKDYSKPNYGIRYKPNET